MRKISKKKIIVGGVAAALVAGGASLAFAYWTSTGDGSGSATTGTSTSWDVATSGLTGGPLTPGGPSETITVTVTNNNSGHQQLNSLTAAIANANGSTWTAVSGCSASDYTIVVDNPVPAAGVDLASGGTYVSTATISMVDAATNQDGCKNASVPLYFHAS